MVRADRKIIVIAWILAVVCIFSGCVGFMQPDVTQAPFSQATLVTDSPIETSVVPEETEEILSPSESIAVPTPTPEQTPIQVQTPIQTPTPTSTQAPTQAPTTAPTKTPVKTQAPTTAPTTMSTKTPTKTQASTITPTTTPTQGTVTVTQAPIYCRTVLNASQRAAYDAIVAGISNPQSIQTVHGMGNGIKVSVQYQRQSNLEAEVALIIESIIMDHPELFYILNQYSYSYSGSKLTSVTIQTLSKSEAIALKVSVENGIQSYMQKVSSNQDQYEISKQLYELLASDILYSQEKGNRAHSVVGAFVDGQGVCETYAKAYQLLLNRYGIRAFTVSGDGQTSKGNEPHRWIAMEINGNWYYSDPTWGDLKTNGDSSTYPKEGYIKVNYAYLHLTAEQMGKDHTLDTTSKQMTQGLSFTATVDNYFVKENGYFTTMDYTRAEMYIKTKLAEAHADQAETFGIQMGDITAYYAMKDYIHNNLYRLYHMAVPGGTASLSYYMNEEQCVLHVYIR